MKVITLISGGDSGGAKTHVHSLLQNLSRTIEVTMVCFLEGPFAQEARELGMEAFLTVGGSALHPPRLIVLRYRGGRPGDAPLCLVGKGVTCDTGGYCLKAASSMKGIKGDMAGAAAVCGALLLLGMALELTLVPRLVQWALGTLS